MLIMKGVRIDPNDDKTIKNKTSAAKLEIKRLTQRASRSKLFINKIILNYIKLF